MNNFIVSCKCTVRVVGIKVNYTQKKAIMGHYQGLNTQLTCNYHYVTTYYQKKQWCCSVFILFYSNLAF